MSTCSTTVSTVVAISNKEVESFMQDTTKWSEWTEWNVQTVKFVWLYSVLYLHVQVE